MPGNLLARTLSRASFAAALGDEAFMSAMLAFESALAQTQAECSVIPAEAGKVIQAACTNAKLPADQLAAQGKLAGSLAIPFVRALTEQVRATDSKAAPFVHYGSTSQDVLDTAMMLCIRPCVAEADRILDQAIAQFATHARQQASAVMLGRTMMQPASPITAGVKIARWAASLGRCRQRLAQTAERALCVQLGGPVGTLDVLGERRSVVRRAVAKRLGLRDAPSWQTHRDEVLSFASSVAILVATIGKIARDIALLSQAEIGEMLESAQKKGVGTSSAMPHKRNPVSCLQAIAAATRAPGLLATLLHAGHEHERAIGGWQAELATLSDLLETAGSALDALERIAAGLVVQPERMKQNLEALQGLVFSERLSRLLMRTMGREAAQSQVDDWCALAVSARRELSDVVRDARPELDLASVFSLDSIIRELAPVLEEELAAL
jgi:3-carboxy-cis,cis-muconate cycloisomerase